MQQNQPELIVMYKFKNIIYLELKLKTLNIVEIKKILFI